MTDEDYENIYDTPEKYVFYKTEQARIMVDLETGESEVVEEW